MDSRYSLVASLGELIFNIECRCKLDVCVVVTEFLFNRPPQQGACGGVVAVLSGTTINWKPYKWAEINVSIKKSPKKIILQIFT